MLDQSSLWNRMWGETKFVPSQPSTEKPVDDNDRIAKLEHRVKALEMRLKKLSRI